jgi:hypothetical protein
LSAAVPPSHHRTGRRTNSHGPVEIRRANFVVLRVLVGTRVVGGTVAGCGYRVSAVDCAFSGGCVAVVRSAIDALAAGEI